MNYTLFDFLQLIGALGIFIFGMKIFSEGLQKVAGSRLKSVLSGMTRNRVTGVFTGFATTTITQSSTTTTVMAVSFVNAGLLTFVESTGVIMGANIGTTVTAWIVALFGFKMKITPIAMAVIGLFFAFLFSKNSRLRNIAETMVGFGILFIGLEFIKNGVPDIRSNPEILEFLDMFTGFGYASLLIFVVIGTLLTLVMQSSSAATAVTLVMLFEGWISFPLAAAMVLGENIGTTVTANLAAMVGNVHAKRAARFHLIFNLIGVAWMLAAIYPVMHLIDMVVQNFSTAPVSILSDAPEARPNATLGLSLFHTSFNILNVILLFAFIPYIVRFIERILPETAGGADDFRLKYISAGVMTSPALALEQAQKEAQQFAGILNRMHADVDELLFDNKASRSRLLKRIAAAEEATDQLEIEISDYLVRVSENTNLEHDLTERIRFLQTMINDMERIADIYFQISKLSERLHEARSHWPDDARADMVQMMEALRAAVENMQQSASMEPSEVSLERAIELENRIDELRDSFRDTHFLRLENGDYSPRAGVIFIDVLNRIERIGDHILNVNESAANHRLKAQRV
ncbi:MULTISPECIES: Na/Pi cotransporter family protein [Thalassolituus]|jgi:phosphate:Na+ symporter|uniref:Na/Pi cotransporter family protein n=5 Tax=Oceanospirillaceae TaxID=135620 RepID=UPI000C44CF6D|nr:MULTISPECIES: Na/Pi cotransporter family protein [Thalassolituus]MAG42740.1 Na/Pi cotransporter [Oceanospirillaceae bacterium]MEC8907572.1 Na/Pi cotransporter family protein [Pseudomonadota bacterium]HCG78054.1 Na/Pi cotransporter [Oceanospirillales bacterium]MAX87670.1 Na/Pi cotransporter [Oceanospirillaceae bacterium]MEE3159975.1 Na/Pi cotransporter family protein [Pseudomonadota bacterium]|tara:strand:+ start:407 stop:2131 length:1725 start_codon:yes stop_codon:yes gene_type:complete